jgi:hypothetical protein
VRSGRQPVHIHAQIEQSGCDIGVRTARGCWNGPVARKDDLRIVAANDRHEVVRVRRRAEVLRDEWFEKLALQPIAIQHDKDDAAWPARVRNHRERSSPLDPPKARNPDDERRRRRIDGIGHENRRRDASNRRDARSGVAHGPQVGRPLARLECVPLEIEPLQIAGRSALKHVDGTDETWHGRGRLPPVVRVAKRRRRLGVKTIAVHVKGHVRPSYFVVELLRELRHTCTQCGAHPIALGVADFAEPAVLQRGERGEQHEQHGCREQLPGSPSHGSTLPRRFAGTPALYISYKTIAQR